MQDNRAAGQSSLLEFETASDADEWQRTIAQSCLPDEAQQMAGYGRCWAASGQHGSLVLSLVAADYLGVAPGLHVDPDPA